MSKVPSKSGAASAIRAPPACQRHHPSAELNELAASSRASLPAANWQGRNRRVANWQAGRKKPYGKRQPERPVGSTPAIAKGSVQARRTPSGVASEDEGQLSHSPQPSSPQAPEPIASSAALATSARRGGPRRGQATGPAERGAPGQTRPQATPRPAPSVTAQRGGPNDGPARGERHETASRKPTQHPSRTQTA